MGNSTIPNYSYESPVGPWQLPTNPADTIMPGDLLYFDVAALSNTLTARPLTNASTQSAYFCGVAMGEYPPSSNIDNTVTTSPAFVSVSMGGLHRGQYDTSGDAQTPGVALYAGANQRTITTTAAGSIIGYNWDFGLGASTAAGTEQPQWRPIMQWPSPYLTSRF